MRRLLACSLLFALLAASVCVKPGLAKPPASCGASGEIEEILQKLSQITGFGRLRKLDCDSISRDEIKEFLERRIREEVKPEEIRIEEIVLKKFGFVPKDFDLKKTTVELFTEQAAAFYDFRKGKLFLLESADPALREIALVHELAHALADQHFRLEKFLDGAGNNDDGALARMAVMEGQATWLMSELAAQRTGQSLRNSSELVDLMSKMVAVSAAGFPVFDSAPLYIRESLLFPYVNGMKFQQAVVEEMGREAFTAVFRRPPISTRQVLHPKSYLKSSGADPVQPPRLARERPYRELAEGVVGEFDHIVLLRQYLGDAAAARLAPSWRAGSYRLLEHKKDKRTVLAYASAWDTPATAEEFFDLYRKVLAGKWETLEVTVEEEHRLAGHGDDGYFQVRLDGSRVHSIEGMKEPGEAR